MFSELLEDQLKGDLADLAGIDDVYLHSVWITGHEVIEVTISAAQEQLKLSEPVLSDDQVKEFVIGVSQFIIFNQIFPRYVAIVL